MATADNHNLHYYLEVFNKPATCPTCGAYTRQGDLDNQAIRPHQPRTCPTCGTYLKTETRKQDTQEQKKTYDEQVKVVYRGSYDPAKNVKYKLLERDSKKILAEGKTDENGLTERVSTDGPKHVEVVIIRLNDEQKEVEKIIETVAITTNDWKDSIGVVNIPKGRIFFDIRYVNDEKDKARSFIKAAETQKRKAAGGGYDKYYKGDVWWSFPVTSECDITAAWQKLLELQQKTGMEIEEGHLFTHASKDGEDGQPGLTFAKKEKCDQDATLTLKEIKELSPLKWSNTSTLWLYGCRTGLPLPDEGNKTMADAFFDTQPLITVIAQRGFGYFSYNLEYYDAIRDDVNDTRNIYLWAFNRRLNVDKKNAALAKYVSEKLEAGDGKAIPPYKLVRLWPELPKRPERP